MPATAWAILPATRVGRKANAGTTADGAACNAEASKIRCTTIGADTRLERGLRGSADDKT